jgi:hypothetical protein
MELVRPTSSGAMEPAFPEMAAEARRLAGRPISAAVRRNAEGAMLIIDLREAAKGEGRRLSDALKEFRARRGLAAPFLVVSTGPASPRPAPPVPDGR